MICDAHSTQLRQRDIAVLAVVVMRLQVGDYFYVKQVLKALKNLMDVFEGKDRREMITVKGA